MAMALAVESAMSPQSSVFFFSFVALSTAYHILTPHFTTTKQWSWIITTIASCVMTLVSLPFIADLVTHGGCVKYVRSLPMLSIAANRFFQAYLLADLSTGFVFYRSHINILTGWFHHILYILIVEYAIRSSWSHVFCLAAFMELPTFILGISSLYPSLRSNILFAVTFFMTRIAFHVLLCVSYYKSDNRLHALNGSFAPAMILTCVFPLHVSWFYGCIKGFVRRAKQSRERAAAVASAVSAANTSSISVIKLDIYSSPSSSQLTATQSHSRLRHNPIPRSRSCSPAPAKVHSTTTALATPLPTRFPLSSRLLRRPYTHYTHYRTRLSQRRQVLEKALREIKNGYKGYAEHVKSAARPVTGPIVELFPALGMWEWGLGGTRRDVLYECVGLGIRRSTGRRLKAVEGAEEILVAAS